MPSLIDIRRRIRSVKNTQQITRAMKMVAAAKLRRAQDRLVAYLRDLPSEGMKAVEESGKLEPETAAKLKKEIEGFNKNHWQPAKPAAAAGAPA